MDFTIKKDKEGNFGRVWVEQKVKDTEPLLKLQREAASINPNLKPESLEGLHMTLAHFGIPEELYEDFRRLNPHLILAEFMEQFYKLIQKCDSAIKEETEVQAEKLDLLGRAPHYVAAVKVVKTTEIMQRREVVSQALQQFIENLGITDVHHFMLQSPNLQFEPDEVYKPHITLGYVGENTTLPQIDVSSLKIILKPSDIGGVEKNPN